MCANILHLWLILHISWLYTKLSVARSRRPSQFVCLAFLVWRPSKILPASEQTDHYLERRGEGLSRWGKAFFKFNWPSSLWSTFHFSLVSSRLIPSFRLFLRAEVVLLPNFTRCWRGKTVLLNQGKSFRLVNQVFVLVTGHLGAAKFWHRTLIFRFRAVGSPLTRHRVKE